MGSFGARSWLLSGCCLLAMPLAWGCGDADDQGSAGQGTAGTAGAGGAGGMLTGGTGGAGGTGGSGGAGPCTGNCSPEGARCTIDPPAGSDAPSILCSCAATGRWCCDGTGCLPDAGGSGGTGGMADGGAGCTQDCASQGLTCCAGKCVNTGNDILNCGGCGTACMGPSPFCGGGTCGTPPCSASSCGAATCCGSTCCASGQLCCEVNVGPSTLGCHDPVEGTCPVGCPQCVCASADSLISTPHGEVPIHAVRPGDLVYSVDDTGIVVATVLQVNRVPVTAHRMVRVTLDGGAVVEMSAGHPTADGRSFAELQVGEWLGELRIQDVRSVDYAHPYTYDLLPNTPSGAYFASGALVGSTLHAVALPVVVTEP